MRLRDLETLGLSVVLVLQMITAVLPIEASGQISWSVGVVAGPNDVGFESISLALNSSGGPHIAFHDETSTSLQFARWNGTQWLFETIYAPGDPGQFASMKMDVDGYAHVSYRDGTDLAYSNNTSGSWARQVVDFSGNLGLYTSLALKDGKYPCISYYDLTNSALKYASYDGVTWNFVIVDNSAIVGQYSSLALDTAGNPHISYYNSTSADLMHAWWDGFAWKTETVDSAGSVGRFASIAIDTSNNIHVSYANETAIVSLKYARKSGTSWTFETVDPGPDVGLHTSIALNPLGLPAIGYYDVGNARLMFASTNGVTWDIDVVDDQGPTGDVGQYTSLALSASGTPSIAYWDAINNDVKYASGSMDYIDLMVAPSDVLFTPGQPYDPGTVVTINATIHNLGNQNASDVLVRFYDGTPGPANQIDGDRVISLLPQGGSFGVNVTWTAQPMGEHCINTVVDPDNTIAEFSETNNVAVNCVMVNGPDLLLIPSRITLDPPGNVSLSSSVLISANVSNQGVGNASSVLVRFWDGLPGTTQIGSDRVIPLIMAGSNQTANVTWTAQPVGSHQICVQADPDNTVAETNETNNDACVSVIVTLPDLEVHAGDLVANPPGSVIDGTPVTFNLTFRNIGGLPAPSVIVSLYDGLPGSGSEVLLGNRTSPPMLSGASQVENWSWNANGTGTHTFYGVLDGDGILAELNESNNQVNITITVIMQTDFVTTSFTATPPGPVLPGAMVDLNATWENMEATAATAEFAIYEDLNSNSVLDPGELLASWRLTLAGSESASRAATWSSTDAGFHTLCALADSLKEVAETQEGNNQMCLTVEVMGKPDLVPINPLPTPPITAGIGQVIQLSLQVRNQGGSAAGPSTLTFRNQSEAVPFQTFDVPSLSVAEISTRYTAVWQAPMITGIYTVEATVDNGSAVDESNEANNVQLFLITVSDLPQTTLYVGNPNYTATVTFVTSMTPFTLVARDFSGTGIKQILYIIDGGLPNLYTSPFILVGEGPHSVEYFSEDNAGNVEQPKTANFTVDDSPPVSSRAIGSPSYGVGGLWIDSTTPITLSAVDNPAESSGVKSTQYRVYDGSNWGPWSAYSSDLYFLNEASYVLEYTSEDNLGNAESINSLPFKVDKTPPTVTANVGTPRYRGTATDPWNITLATTISAVPVDGGATAVGVQRTQYSLDSAPLANYTVPISLSTEGPHSISFIATDRLGHVSSYYNFSVVVDSTPPTADVQVGTPKYVAVNTWITSATTMTVTSADGGSPPVGVENVTYRTWGGSWTGWTQYSAPFPLGTPEGQRYLEVRAIDHLQNQGSVLNMSLLVDDSPPTGQIAVSEPKYLDVTLILYVSGATQFTMSAADVAPTPSGLAGLRYSVDGSALTDYVSAFELSASSEGTHMITYNATDNLGHSSAGSIDVVLDKTPPTTSFQVSKRSGSGTFWLNATDARAGVNSTYYSVNYGTVQKYTGPVTLPTGDFRVEYYSNDRVGNLETTKVITFNVTTTGGGGGGGPEAEEMNIAPLLGVVLGIVLLAAGILSRKKSRKAMAAGIVLGVAEMVTGILSTFVQDLEIPPWIGLGLIMLLVLFLVGIIAVVMLVRKGAAAQSEARKAEKEAKEAEDLKRDEELTRMKPKRPPPAAGEEELEEMEEPDEGELEEALKSLEELKE